MALTSDHTSYTWRTRSRHAACRPLAHSKAERFSPTALRDRADGWTYQNPAHSSQLAAPRPLAPTSQWHRKHRADSQTQRHDAVQGPNCERFIALTIFLAPRRTRHGFLHCEWPRFHPHDRRPNCASFRSRASVSCPAESMNTLPWEG